jgi:Fis family transcriptional regulator
MSKQQIETVVRESMAAYFQDLDGTPPHDLHAMMLACFERPLLEAVMFKAGGNQSKAAQWLGLNRNTLRKKLSDLGLSND